MNITGNFRSSWPRPDEIVLLHKMDELYFPRPWSLEQWQELNKSNHHLFLWIDGDKTIGFSLLGQVPGDETAHLLKICLEPSARGKDEAEGFWKEIAGELKSRNVTKIFLEVEESNINAQFFYKKVGFQLLRTVRAYYSDGENGLMMLLTL